MLKYCLDRYKTQEICHKAVDAYLPLLKFVPHWFVTNMMLKDLDNAISLNGGIVFVNANSGNVTFLVMMWVLLMLILLILALMIIILTMMILKLFFTLDLSFSVIDISHARHVKIMR